MKLINQIKIALSNLNVSRIGKNIIFLYLERGNLMSNAEKMATCHQCGKWKEVIQNARVVSIIGMCEECAAKYARQVHTEKNEQLKDLAAQGVSFLRKLFK